MALVYHVTLWGKRFLERAAGGQRFTGFNVMVAVWLVCMLTPQVLCVCEWQFREAAFWILLSSPRCPWASRVPLRLQG